mgnify:CR=1 FL=1|tara:strand:- start:345 stop:980 length:636 start_codon:yes stop_codon:yes gene_type:complete
MNTKKTHFASLISILSGFRPERKIKNFKKNKISYSFLRLRKGLNMYITDLLEDKKTYHVLKEYATGEKILKIQEGFGLSASSLYEIINKCDVIKRRELPVQTRSIVDLSLRARKVVQKGFYEYKVLDAKDCLTLFGIESVKNHVQVTTEDFNTFFEKAEDLKRVMGKISDLESEAEELLLDLTHNNKCLNASKDMATNLKHTLSALLKNTL